MNAQIINLPKILDKRGNLTFLEGFTHIPFAIRRVYWIYDVPGGEFRGSHAFKKSEEFVIALSGSFDVIVDNSIEKKVFSLNRSHYGLYLPKLSWREINNFSTNAVALIISSTLYDPSDYIRNYDEFKRKVL